MRTAPRSGIDGLAPRATQAAADARRRWEAERWLPWRFAESEREGVDGASPRGRGASFLARTGDDVADEPHGRWLGHVERRRAAAVAVDCAAAAGTRAAWCPAPPPSVRCRACGAAVDEDDLVAARHVLRCLASPAVAQRLADGRLEPTWAEAARAWAAAVDAAAGPLDDDGAGRVDAAIDRVAQLSDDAAARAARHSSGRSGAPTRGSGPGATQRKTQRNRRLVK